MTIVVAFDEIPQEKIRKNPGGPDRPVSTNYPFFRSTADAPDGPMAFLAQYDPGERSCTHYHQVDQFQILVKGKGQFGRHAVAPYYVHFARAYTPYGPLNADEKTGWTFMTLRAQFDPGAQRLPGALGKLKESNRKPWQVTVPASFPARGTGIAVQDVAEVSDDQGLFVKTLTMAPGASMTAPAAAGGSGQYVIAVGGSLVHEGKERKAITVVFVKPDEPAFRIQAGPQGLEALILNFPRVGERAPETQTAPAAGFRKWQCVLCAFFYDEALGIPEEGIAAGTRWEDVPESWNCPDCSATKKDFVMVEI